MLIEVKAKVAWKIDGKVKKKTETFILDKEVFAQAELGVMSFLQAKNNSGTVENYEITGLRLSAIKEIITQYEGENTFIATLRDTVLIDDAEKQVKYKVLLWANSITEAMNHAKEVASQGYDMQIDGLREVSYTYLNYDSDESETPENTEPEGA